MKTLCTHGFMGSAADYVTAYGKQPPVVHVYAHDHHHGAVAIVGNREGLLALRATLDRAIEGGRALTSVVPADDGEGYDLTAFCLNEPFGSEVWSRMPNHYDTHPCPDGVIAGAASGGKG